MIDAYTIGITLALDDGVSAGVAAIARDLAALDRAIDAGTLRLTKLRQVADGAVSVMRPPPPTGVVRNRVAPVSVEPVAAAAPAIRATSRNAPAQPALPAPPVAYSAGPAAMPSQRNPGPPPAAPMPKPVPPAVPPVVVTTHIAPPAPVAPIVVVPPAADAGAPPPAVPVVQPAVPPVAAPSPVSAASVAPIVHVVQPAAPPPAAPSPVPTVPVAPAHLPDPMPRPAVPIAPRSAAPLEPHAFDLSAFARRMVPLVARPATQPLEVRSSSASPPQLRLVPDHGVPVSPTHLPDARTPRALPRSAEEDSGRAAAPRSPEQRWLHLPAATSAISLPAAPSAGVAQMSHGPGGGDVFLDGVHVGHWLSRHLDRAANRPPAGTTGFDPRLSPSWAGATVSN